MSFNLCIAVHREPTVSETFIRAHAERLPGKVTLLYGEMPHKDGRPLWSDSPIHRMYHKGRRLLSGHDIRTDVTTNYLRAFHKLKTTAVLAEYGLAGVLVMEACRRANIPLVVHFHGYDASDASVLARQQDNYKTLFNTCASIVVPSRAMKKQLVSLGAPLATIFCNPCGVDCNLFKGACPEYAQPIFLAVGRFVEKKAPHLTLLAFARVYEAFPAVRLRMIGEGPLLGTCRDLAQALDLNESVTFLGAQPHDVVLAEMKRSRAFVQHSVKASSGDAEGTPVSILEAAAVGLPIVSTRHAGIPEVIVEGETGFLVEERDVRGMADHMLRLARNPDLAGVLGRASRGRIEENFSMEKSIANLWSIIESSILHRTVKKTTSSLSLAVNHKELHK